EAHLVNVPQIVRHLAGADFDLAHPFFATDAWAALKARRFGGPPVVFSIHGILMREYLVARRYRIETMRAAIAGAEAVSVLSSAAADPLRRYFLTEPAILPGGVVGDRFALDVARAEAPTIVCAASLGDPY